MGNDLFAKLDHFNIKKNEFAYKTPFDCCEKKCKFLGLDPNSFVSA